MLDNELNEADFPTPKGWKTPPSLRELKQDLLEATPAHDTQTGKIGVWVDNMNMTGKAKPLNIKGRSAAAPKLIKKQAEWRYPSLSEPFLSTDDMFSLAPTTWEDAQSAQQNQLVLNNQFNTKIDKVKFIDEFIRAVVDEGTVIVRTGWEFEEKEVTEDKPIVEFVVNPEMLQVHQELAQMKGDNPTGYQHEVPEELQIAHEESMRVGEPLEPIITGYEEVTRMKTVRNIPTVEVCDYRNVILDPSCRGDLDKAGFVIFSFETSLSALKKETGRYKNLDRINKENASVLADPDHTVDDNTNFNFSDEARKKFVAHEYWGYWDIDDSGIAQPIVATWVGNVLIRLESNPYPDGKPPFVFVPLRPVKHSAYGEPDGELIEDNQRIIGALTRGMIDIMARSANGQMGVRKDALDATNWRKFQKGQDYEYNGNVDPRLAFYMHTYAEIPNSSQFMLQQQSLEAESLTGVKAFSNGINGDGLGDVVAGIRGALDAASKREISILRRLASGMAKVARKMIAMNGEFLEDEEIVRVTNDEFVTVRRDDLAGNFDLKLDISSAEEDASKAQELAFMLQTLGNNSDAGMVKLILRDIARLRKMPELAKKIEDFQPEPDPLQELEMQKLQAEIAEIQSRTQENMANAQLDQAKSGTEQAKTRQLNSQSDNQDLDFVEQESGVKQERDKELQGEQARANMDLETHKAKLAEGERQQTALEAYLKKS